MTRYVELEEILHLHARIVQESGGADGLRDLAMLESALAQPRMTFGGQDLYPSIAEKAAALGFSLIANHPFVDGNKRIGHAAIEAFLMRNGWELIDDVDQQEAVILQVASGTLSREGFTTWVGAHVQPLPT
jgi:death-on-curing protein